MKAIATLQVIGPPSQTAGVYGIVLNPYSVQLYWTDGSVNGQPIIYYVIESYNMNDKIWISAKLGTLLMRKYLIFSQLFFCIKNTMKSVN